MISAMCERYSATVNFAPSNGVPRLGWSTGWLMRTLVESCATDRSLMNGLRNYNSIFPFFAHVVSDRSLIVEKLQRGIYAYCGDVKTNHYLSSYNYQVEWLEDSIEREASLRVSKGGPLKTINKVVNECTVQTMVMCPSKGEIRLKT